MRAAPLYALAALAENVGCFSVWAWWRQGASAHWLVSGLTAFAWLLAPSPADQAGRAFAAYGGAYIVASLLWLWPSRAPGRTVGTSRERRSAFSARR